MIFGTLFSILFLGGFILLVLRSKRFECDGIPRQWFLIALAFKLSCAFFLWLIYSYYYPDRLHADIFKYFDDAKSIYEHTSTSIGLRWKIISGFYDDGIAKAVVTDTNYWDRKTTYWVNDNRSMIRLHLFLLHISNGMYHFHALFFTALSFLGSWGIYKSLSPLSSLPKKLLFFVIFCLPSTIFWSAGALKESWLTFLIGMSLSLLLKEKILHQWKANIIILCLLIFGLMFPVKVFVLAILFVGLISFKLANTFQRIPVFIFYCLSFFGLGGIGLLSKYNVVEIIRSTQNEFLNLVKTTNLTNTIKLPEFDTAFNLITGSFHALWNVILGPLYPASINAFSMMASLEHIPYTVCLFLPLFFFRKVNRLELNMGLFLGFVFLAVFIIIGSTTPILGALVRYKSPLIPFYLIGLFTFVHWSKLKPNRLK